MAKRTAHDVVRDLVKAAGFWDAATAAGEATGILPTGDSEVGQKQFVESSKQLAQDPGALIPAVSKITQNPHAQRGLNEGLQERAGKIPIIGGLFGKSSALFDVTSGRIQDSINKAMDTQLANPEDARQLGRAMSGAPTTQTSSASPGAKAFGSHIAAAVGNAMPDAPKLDTIPSLIMGAGRMFGKMGDFIDTLPAEVGAEAGDQFKGSPAAGTAANAISPMVNKSFTNLWDNSVPGKIMGFFSDPSKLIDESAARLGIKKPTTGTPAKG